MVDMTMGLGPAPHFVIPRVVVWCLILIFQLALIGFLLIYSGLWFFTRPDPLP